jgi:hypothetical protein
MRTKQTHEGKVLGQAGRRFVSSVVGSRRQATGWTHKGGQLDVGRPAMRRRYMRYRREDGILQNEDALVGVSTTQGQEDEREHRVCAAAESLGCLDSKSLSLAGA